MSEMTFADIWDDCTDRLNANTSIEECLNLYPDYAEQLYPLLLAAQAMQQSATLPVAQVQAERDAVWGKIEAQLHPKRARIIPLRFLQWVAVLLVIVGGGLLFAQQSLPGDALYPLKRLGEAGHIFLAGGSQAIRDQYNDRRFDEIARLFTLDREADVMFYARLEAEDADVWQVRGIPIQIDNNTAGAELAQSGRDYTIDARTTRAETLQALRLQPIDDDPIPELIPSLTPLPTMVPSLTPTPTSTASPTMTATVTTTDLPTEAETTTPTATTTPSLTTTNMPTATATPSLTTTNTASPTATMTATDVSTATATMTRTETAVPTATGTATATDLSTETSTATASPTITLTASLTPTIAPTQTETTVPSSTPTNTPTSTSTLPATLTGDMMLLEGVVEVIDGNMLTVSGLTIVVDEGEPLLSQLEVGDFIRIQTQMATNGELQAVALRQIEDREPAGCVVMPADGWIEYGVQGGDTLSSIASRTGTTIGELSRVNCIEQAGFISVGQVLFVPNAPPSLNPPTSLPPRGEEQAASPVGNTNEGNGDSGASGSNDNNNGSGDSTNNTNTNDNVNDNNNSGSSGNSGSGSSNSGSGNSGSGSGSGDDDDDNSGSGNSGSSSSNSGSGNSGSGSGNSGSGNSGSGSDDDDDDDNSGSGNLGSGSNDDDDD